MIFSIFFTGPPRVRSDPVQYGMEGEVVKLQCVIASVPPPTRILWSRNSQVILHIN